MSSPPVREPATPSPRIPGRELASSPLTDDYHVLPAFLSYLVPGLGQIAQGRIGKGILFFVCVLTLFYYGMHLGSWSNVYLPRVEDPNARTHPLLVNLWHRPQFAGQFWVGIAAWPAVVQYATYDPRAEAGPLFGTYQRIPSDTRLIQLQQESDKTWDLAWVFTVIAGVLNIMVIYDALAGPAFVVLREGESGA